MIPQRFRQLRPYLASFFYNEFPRPHPREMLRWFTQPGKEARARRFIERTEKEGDFVKVVFRGWSQPFYYPAACSWVDFCQTVDECFSPANWHHFISPETPVGKDDVVVDCGAAEGLFSFVVAPVARQVYAIEPVPIWHAGLKKTFSAFKNVTIFPVGVGHKVTTVKMSNDEVHSKVTSDGGIDVPMKTLDALFADQDIPITFLKADVEGFEFPLILGAEQTIRKYRPKVALTVYHSANHFIEIRDFLRMLHPTYRFKTRGMAANGHPILLMAY